MHPHLVHAWIQGVETLPAAAIDQTPFDNPLFCHTASDAQSVIPCGALEFFSQFTMSPSKKQRLVDEKDERPLDPDATPTQTQPPATARYSADDVFGSPQPRNLTPFVQSSLPSTGDRESSSTSSTEPLNPQSQFSLPITRRTLPQAHASSPNGRTPSPSKRYRKTSDLLNLDRPVRYCKTNDMRGALPDDMHRLYNELVKVEYNEEIFPEELNDDPAINISDPRPYMWRPSDKSVSPDVALARAQETNRRIQGIITDSGQCWNWKRSESAWNTIVHYPLLRLFTDHLLSVHAEPITSAQIAPAFRPTFNHIPDDASSQSSATSLSSAVSSIRRHGNSVHKMVDFALVLTPSRDLQAGIDRYTQTSVTATINQTAYYPLKSWPAPVSIETKTGDGKLEDAHVQLGVWVAAWHESMRELLRSHGHHGKIITVPLIHVFNGTWTVMFAIDAGEEIVSHVVIPIIKTPSANGNQAHFR